GIFSWPTNKPTAEVEVDTSVSRPATPIEVPGITPVGTVNVPVTQDTGPVKLPPPPPVAAPQYQDPEVTGYARTTAEGVNLRRGPSIDYRASLVLPRGWQVLVLRQTHVDNAGEVWIEVSVWTQQGFERGWINQRYLVLTR